MSEVTSILQSQCPSELQESQELEVLQEEEPSDYEYEEMSYLIYSNMESECPSQSQESKELEALKDEEPSNYKHEEMSDLICSNLESEWPSQAKECQELEALQEEEPSNYKHEEMSDLICSNLESEWPSQAKECQELDALQEEEPSNYKHEEMNDLNCSNLESEWPSQSQESQEFEALLRDPSDYTHEVLSGVADSNLENQGPLQSQEIQQFEVLQKEEPSDYKLEVINEVTCSTLESQCLSQSQESQEFEALSKEEIINYKHKDLPAPSASWKMSTVILGTICLALILTLGYFVTMYDLSEFSLANPNPSLLTAEVLPGNFSYIEEANETVNQSSVNPEGHPGNISSNKEANETVWKYPSCLHNWLQHGENCYYFSRTKSLWKGCEVSCTKLESKFLKVDNEDEMVLIIKLSKLQCEMRQEKFFISVLYNSTQFKWFWLNGKALNMDYLQTLGHENAENKCTYIKNGQMHAEDCQIDGYCICKKTVY